MSPVGENDESLVTETNDAMARKTLQSPRRTRNQETSGRMPEVQGKSECSDLVEPLHRSNICVVLAQHTQRFLCAFASKDLAIASLRQLIGKRLLKSIIERSDDDSYDGYAHTEVSDKNGNKWIVRVMPLHDTIVSDFTEQTSVKPRTLADEVQNPSETALALAALG